MLQSLKIENIAIIEHAEIELSNGFNVLTGETGAGKSIIIDSINAVMGERTSKELIRTGASSASVTAMFTNCPASAVEKLESYEIPYDGEVLIKRTLNEDGRSSCRINGSTVTTIMLRGLCRELINIHGQHDNQELLQAAGHCGFVDRMAKNSEILREYYELFEKIKAMKKMLRECEIDEDEKQARLDMLDFQINELTDADIRVGEKDELISKKSLYQNMERVMQSLGSAYAALNGSDEEAGAVRQLSAAADCLGEAEKYFPDMKQAVEWMRNASYDLEEYTRQIRDAFSSLEFDGDDMARVEERLDTLHRLSRKYGSTEEEMLDFLQKAEDEKRSITLSDERAQELSKEIFSCKTKLAELAADITESRKKAGKLFEQGVKRELEFLDMPGVTFVVDIRPTEYTCDGADDVEFLISANVGEAPKPLAKIASGGELSRIMLAIKNVLSENDSVSTLIFDEVDSGVSGRAAQKVGLKLREVSGSHQVICVTHLSQIAVLADTHLLISKDTKDGKTYTRVKELDLEGRKYEIARINGGINITELQLRNAEEMLIAAAKANNG